MQIKILDKNHHSDMINLLNVSFSKNYNRDMNFENEIMQLRHDDNEFMNKHIGVFENDTLVAALGIYTNKMLVGNSELSFATIGNVVTDSSHRGKGYMSLLLNTAIKHIKENNMDFAKLGGQRFRYARFGFEPVGFVHEFEFTKNNRIKCCKNFINDIEFKIIQQSDLEYLQFVKETYEKQSVYIKREYSKDLIDIYYILNSFKNTGYIALRNNKPIGYFSASPDLINIEFFGYVDTFAFRDILCAWQEKIDNYVIFRLEAYQFNEISLAQKMCEYMSEFAPCHYNIFNYDKVANAFLKLQSSYMNFSDGEIVLEIKDYGKIKLFAHNGKAEAIKTNDKADIVLDSHSAMQILFGYSGKYYLPKNISGIIRQFCPIFLGGKKHDDI